jgi:hypothetical protein
MLLALLRIVVMVESVAVMEALLCMCINTRRMSRLLSVPI